MPGPDEISEYITDADDRKALQISLIVGAILLVAVLLCCCLDEYFRNGGREAVERARSDASSRARRGCLAATLAKFFYPLAKFCECAGIANRISRYAQFGSGAPFSHSIDSHMSTVAAGSDSDDPEAAAGGGTDVVVSFVTARDGVEDAAAGVGGGGAATRQTTGAPASGYGATGDTRE